MRWALPNADGSLALLIRNELPNAQMVQVQVRDRSIAIELPPDSVGTLVLKPA
jgi:hypothetical protein